MSTEVIARAGSPVRVHICPSNQTRRQVEPLAEWGEPWRFVVENTTHHNLTCRIRPALKPEDASLYATAEMATNGYPEQWTPAGITTTDKGRMIRIGPRERLNVGVRLKVTMPVRLTVGLRVVPVGR